MRMERRLKIDFTWVLAGNIFYSACQWMIVVVLAKLGTPEKLGEYAWGLAVSAPIVLFANFQLRSLLASDLTDRFRFRQYLIFRLISIGAALGLVAVVAEVAGSGEKATVVILVGAAQAVELVSEIFYGLMQREDRMDRISRSLMYRGGLSLASMATTMYFTRSIVWALAALFLSRLFILFTWDASFAPVKSALRIAPSENHDWMPALFRTALPLGVISMLVSLNANVTRYFVEAHRGSAELGMYSAVASLLSAGTLVVSAYGQALFLPVAKACVSANRAEFRKFALLTVILGAILGTCAILISILFGRAILTHLFRPEYGQYADILVRLMIAGTLAFIAAGLGFVMTAARSLRPQVPLLVITGAATVVCSAFLIPRYGLMGAADASILAAAVQLAGTGVILRRIDRRFDKIPASGRVVDDLPVQIVEVEAV
jgi:O-antigen/teichoic acid export membrane protein